MSSVWLSGHPSFPLPELSSELNSRWQESVRTRLLPPGCVTKEQALTSPVLGFSICMHCEVTALQNSRLPVLKLWPFHFKRHTLFSSLSLPSILAQLSCLIVNAWTQESCMGRGHGCGWTFIDPVNPVTIHFFVSKGTGG